MRYWDSSAVVPLLVRQVTSKKVLSLFRSDPVIVTWWGTRVECDSAVARLEREGTLSEGAVRQALRRLDLLLSSWQEMQPVDFLRQEARRFLRVHDLRAGDSLQLAAAVMASEGRPGTLDFVCLDNRLSRAAQREGFPLIEA